MRGRALGVISLAIGAGPLGALMIGAIASMHSTPFAIGFDAVLGIVLLSSVALLMPSLWPTTDDFRRADCQGQLMAQSGITTRRDACVKRRFLRW